MNRLPAQIIAIETAEHLSLVDLEMDGARFSCVIIETPETAPYLRVGNTVTIIFKETEVSIGKNLSGQLSLRNQIPGRIKRLRKGGVLAEIVLEYRDREIVSIITARSAERLNLQVGDAVVGLIKANEVAIMAGGDEDDV